MTRRWKKGTKRKQGKDMVVKVKGTYSVMMTERTRKKRKMKRMKRMKRTKKTRKQSQTMRRRRMCMERKC